MLVVGPVSLAALPALAAAVVLLAILATWHYARRRVEARTLPDGHAVVTLALGPFPWSEAGVGIVAPGGLSRLDPPARGDPTPPPPTSAVAPGGRPL